MEDQILLIDKPAGISSFGVVARVRHKLSKDFGHKIKVGHTGTLDPFATGLLILLTGKNTKRSNDFLKLDKTYLATLHLGAISTTGDPEGTITPQSDRVPTLSEIEQLLPEFVGEITQQVPTFSAVKIQGRRAYELARKGQTFETPIRQVTIFSLEVLAYHYPELKIQCHVSSGTYVRTLASDLGARLGTGAYLTALHRLSVGQYSINASRPLSDFA